MNRVDQAIYVSGVFAILVVIASAPLLASELRAQWRWTWRQRAQRWLTWLRGEDQ